MNKLNGVRLLAAALVWAPMTVSLTHAQDIFYVSNFGNNTIEKFDASGGDLGTFASTGLNGPSGLAFDTSGNLFVANYNDSTIWEFDSSGAGTLFASGTGLNLPVGLAFDSSGDLYAASSGNDSLIEFKNKSGTLSPNGTPFVTGTGSSGVHSLAFDGAGNLYAANLDANAIEKINSSGHGTVFASSGLDLPWGLAFDASGNLYVANSGNNTIEKFSSTGTDLGTFAGSGLNGPEGLAFDQSGNLYAVNATNNPIEKFSSSGTGTLFATNNLNKPTAIATKAGTSPAPEAPAWGLFGAGGAVLLAFRQRNRAKPSSGKAALPR